MRESSNPVFRSLPKQQGGYAQFGTGAAGYGAVQADPYAAQPYLDQGTNVSRPLTIDDVVTKTGITLAVLTAGRSRLLLPGRAERHVGHAVHPRRLPSAASSWC